MSTTEILSKITKHVCCVIFKDGSQLFYPEKTEYEAWSRARKFAQLPTVSKVGWTGSWVNWKWQIVK